MFFSHYYLTSADVLHCSYTSSLLSSFHLFNPNLYYHSGHEKLICHFSYLLSSVVQIQRIVSKIMFTFFPIVTHYKLFPDQLKLPLSMRQNASSKCLKFLIFPRDCIETFVVTSSSVFWRELEGCSILMLGAYN